MDNKKLILTLFTAIIILACFGFTREASADTLILVPDGAGDYTNIYAQYPDSGSHWDKVAPPPAEPDDEGSYIQQNYGGALEWKDAYTLENTGQTGNINSVRVYFRYRSVAGYGAYNSHITPYLRLNTAETAGTTLTINTDPWVTSNEILARPGGGDWNWDDINNLQVCIGLDAYNDLRYPRCTQVYVEVDYTPAAPNQPPDATSVSDSPDPVTVGNDITFTGNWSEPDSGDNVKMYICKDSSCTNCDNTSQTNCWCYSSTWQTEPDTSDTCTYTAQSGDVGDNNYWLGVCDDEPSCDSAPLSGGTFTVEAEAVPEPGWLSGWDYRRAITIDNTGGSTLSDYQVSVTVDTASLISAGKMQLDCDDIRFTDSDGTTDYDCTTGQGCYWIESGCNTSITKIWVKVPEIPASSQKTIYMYYGNSLATSQSSIKNTFIIGDDFNDGSIDSMWAQVDGTWNESNGVISKTGSGGRLRASLPSGFDYIAETKLKPDSWGTDYRMGILSRLAESGSAYAHIFTVMYNNQGQVVDLNELVAWGTAVSPGFTFTTGNWYNFKTLYVGTNQMKGKAWQVGTSEPTWQKDVTFSTSRTERNVGPYAAADSTASWDDFRVRQYADPEPTTSIYAEQDNFSFDYRRPITIDNTGNSNNLYNYQIGPITVDTSDGTRFHNNCADIRFTDDSTNWNEHNWTISYSYWIESGCNSVNTKIWVKVDEILGSSTSTIYMYYGNSSASSGSDGENTFVFFDDFEGTSLDTSKWGLSGSVSVSNSVVTLDRAGSNAKLWNLNNFSVSKPFVVEAKYQHPSRYRNRLYLTTAADSGSPTGYDYGIFDPSIYWNGFTGTNLNTNTWYIVKWIDTTSNYVWKILNIDGSEVISRSHGSSITGTGYVTFSGTESDASDFKLDFVRVRKYADPEPTTEVGSEETRVIVTYSRTATAIYEVINNPPEATTLPPDSTGQCFATYPPVYLYWQFYDPDLGDTRSAYQVQIDNNSDFSLPEDDSCLPSPGTCSPGHRSTTYSPPMAAAISFDATYYWRVRVWDSQGAVSDWSYGPSFHTDPRYPWPDFDWSPKAPTVGEIVQFCSVYEEDVCSENLTTFYDSNPAGRSWSWDFGDGTTSALKNPTHSYSEEKGYTVSLSVIDGAGYGPCTSTDSLSVTVPLPEWKEIPPF